MKNGKLDFDNNLCSPSGLNTQRQSEFSECPHRLHQQHAIHILPEQVALRAGIDDQFALRFQVFAAFVEAAGGSGDEAALALESPAFPTHACDRMKEQTIEGSDAKQRVRKTGASTPWKLC